MERSKRPRQESREDQEGEVTRKKLKSCNDVDFFSQLPPQSKIEKKVSTKLSTTCNNAVHQQSTIITSEKINASFPCMLVHRRPPPNIISEERNVVSRPERSLLDTNSNTTNASILVTSECSAEYPSLEDSSDESVDGTILKEIKKKECVLKEAHHTNARNRTIRFSALAMVCFVFAFSYMNRDLSPPETIANAVYVPGAGFSGFWYTLGRLTSLADPWEKDFYCYSAGCLGAVSILNNFTLDEVYGMARNSQRRWQIGEIGLYDVVPTFVDDLIYGAENDDRQKPRFDESNLPLLHMYTTVKREWGGLRAEVTTPTDLESLRLLLIQTTFIPFATGGDLWHFGHMDGAFTETQHQACEFYARLPFISDIWINTLNVGLTHAKVKEFWDLGFSHGI